MQAMTQVEREQQGEQGAELRVMMVVGEGWLGVSKVAGRCSAWVGGRVCVGLTGVNVCLPPDCCDGAAPIVFAAVILHCAMSCTLTALPCSTCGVVTCLNTVVSPVCLSSTVQLVHSHTMYT